MSPTASAGTAAGSGEAAVATWAEASPAPTAASSAPTRTRGRGAGSATVTPSTSATGGAPTQRASSTPSRLRLASALAALAGLLLAACGAWTLQARTTALHAASSDAAQLTRLQQIDTSLVRADAAVTNAFLARGLEPADARATYDQALASATGLIAQAAAAQPADADALQALNQRLTTYVALVEQARANNHQLFPVGSGYLNAASSWLRSDVLPVVEVLVATTAQRIDGEFASADRHVATFVGLGLLTLATLVALGVWHARRFHRVLNLPLALGTVAVLVATVVGTGVLVASGGKADDARSGPLARSRAASDARVAGFDAKAQESLGLVNQGSGATKYEPLWTTSATAARTDAGKAGPDAAALVAAWDAYAVAHRAVRADDDRGQWASAVAKALDGRAGSANDTFGVFADRSAEIVARGSADTDAQLRDARRLLPWAAGGVILLGLLAAAGGVSGFGQRLKEYQ